MRTFHIGGTAQVAEQSFYEAANDGSVHFQGGNTVQTPEGDLIVMSRNLQLVVQVDGKDRKLYRPPYGARLRVKDGQDVKRGMRLSEWYTYTTPIITEVAGKVRFEDLVEGVREEATRPTSSTASSTGASTKGGYAAHDGGDRRRRQQQIQRRRRPLPLAGGAILSCRRRRRGQARRRAGPVRPKRQDTRHHRRSAAGGGALRGAPAKDCAVIAEMDGRGPRVRDDKNKRRIKITPESVDGEPVEVEFLIPRASTSPSTTAMRDPPGRVPDRRQPRPARHPADFGHRGGDFLVNEIQEVYRLQGVPINDKHIETIVRQMLQKVEILSPVTPAS